MNTKKITSVLTSIFTMFVALFFILAHILAGEGLFFSVIGQGLMKSAQYLFSPTVDVAYLVVVILLIITAAIIIVWVLKLVKAKGKFFDYLQPVIFLFSTLLTLIIIGYRVELQTLYSAQATRLPVLYMFISTLFIMAYGYHLMVFALARLSKTKEEIEVVEPKEVAAPFDEAKVREIVAEELAKQKPVIIEKQVLVKEEPKEEAKVEPKAEPKAEPVKVEKVEKIEPKKEEVKKPEVKKVEPVVVQAPEEEGEEFERLSFEERIKSFEQDALDKYHELKEYILSYGVKSRISSSGDSFRAKRVMYFKITNSGNSGFRVYFKLDLLSYANTTYPLKDARGIKMYEEVPTFMYLKSDLSLKRAKELVDDVMFANGFERKD